MQELNGNEQGNQWSRKPSTKRAGKRNLAFEASFAGPSVVVESRGWEEERMVLSEVILWKGGQ